MKVTDEIREAFLAYLDTVDRINSKNIKYEKALREIRYLTSDIISNLNNDKMPNDGTLAYYRLAGDIKDKIEEVLNEQG